jgi:hypothetical protein
MSEEHVEESRPPGTVASESYGRQPTSATEKLVASPVVPLTDSYEAPLALEHSGSKTLADPESTFEDSERNQTASRVDTSLLNTADPERIQSSSMSGRSSPHTKDSQTTLLSNPNDLLLYSTESERIHAPLDLQGPERSNSLTPVELSSPRIRFETTDILPLNGEDSETGKCLKPIPNNSPNGRVSKPSDLKGNAQTSESVPGERYHTESILDRQDHYTFLSDSSDHPESIFDTTERLESVLDRLDCTEIILEGPDHPQPISKGQDQTDPVSKELDPSEHNSARGNYPKAIPDKQSRSESIKSHEILKGRDQLPQAHREARLHRLRWRSLKTRALVSEKRTELSQLRSEMSDADAEFIKLSRERLIHGSHDDSALLASLKKLQDTRDTYGPVEEAYNTLEEQLDREEYELAELEKKMIKNGVPILESNDSDLESQSISSDEGDSENLDIITEQQNPLYKEYMSRLGDANLLHEAYSHLLSEHDILLQALEASQRYGRELPAEDQTTLAKFYAKDTKMSEELRKIDADVGRLRLECIRNGLLAEEEGDENDILRTSDGVVGPEQAEYNKYPRLLERPGEGEDEKSSKALLSEFKSGDTGDRITRWLLHKLRSSCSEVELLKRFTPGLDHTVDTDKWQEEVLYFWYIDSANLPPSAYELEPTLTAFPSTRLTDPNKASPKPFAEKEFIQVVVRSSSLSRSLEFGMWLKLARMKERSEVTM